MISSLYYRPVHSQKKANKIIKTQSSQTVKTYIELHEGPAQRTPRALHKETPLSHHQIAKYTPKNIIYDKETLYYEVKQLKIALNKLTDENHKLKTRIAISQTQRDKLYRSGQPKYPEERYTKRSSIQKKDGQLRKQIQISSCKLKLELMRKQNQRLNSELKRIKTSAKFWQMQEKEAENKIYLEQNLEMSTKNQELLKKMEELQQILADYEFLRAKVAELSIENKIFVSQIEDMHIEIMKLESQLKKYKYSPVKDQDFQRMILKSHPKHDQSQRKILLQGVKRKQRLAINSLKSHHLYAQPLKSLRKRQFRQTSAARRGSAKSIPTDLFREEVESNSHDNFDMKKKLQQTQLRLKQLQKKIGIRGKIEPKSKDTAVQTSYSSEENQQNLEARNDTKKKQVQPLDIFVKKAQKFEGQQANIEVQHNTELDRQAQSLLFKKQQHKDLQTDLIFENIESSEAEAKQYKSQQNYQNVAAGSNYHRQPYKKTLPTHLHFQNSYKISDELLIVIRKMLTYRFQHQRYTFDDLKKDIEASKAKDFRYIDLCYMLVNEPFFLSVDYSRQVIWFIFESVKPKKDEIVTKGHLISKFRQIIGDFQLLDQSEQTTLIEKCSKLIKQHEKQLRERFNSIQNGPNTTNLSNLTSILSDYSLKESQIDFLISQLSIYSETLQALNYAILFQRFLLSSRSSQQTDREVIIEHEDQENSYLGASNLGKHLQVPNGLVKKQKQQIIFCSQEGENQGYQSPEKPIGQLKQQNQLNNKKGEIILYEPK